MHDIIFFFEPSEKLYETPLKIGKLYLNRFSIDEIAASEIHSVYFLSRAVSRKYGKNMVQAINDKGLE